MENLKVIMEETHPQKNYFPDIDLNLSSCVLDSKNGKRSSCMCVCVCVCEGEIESHDAFTLQPLWMRIDQKNMSLNETTFFMHVTMVQWVDEDDVCF